MSTVHDMLKWVRNPNWGDSHLEGVNQDGKKVIQYCFDTGETLCFIKTANGFPMDQLRYDAHFFYDATTENGWTDPRNYTKNGWPMFARMWDDANQGQMLNNPIAKPQKFVNCHGANPGDVSPTTYYLYGASEYDFGGNIGKLPSIHYDYHWSKINLERWYLTREHGRVLWEYWINVAGVWVKSKFSLHNQVVKGSISPDFPCYSIP